MTQTAINNQNHHKPRKISGINAKGGVGKSTILKNLAHKLAIMGYKILFIECDFQRNTSKMLPKQPKYDLTHVIMEQVPIKKTIYPLRENLFILPAARKLDKAANYIVVNGRRAYDVLKQQIDTLTEYDFILFDYPPNWTAVTEAALRASDELLIPVLLEQYSIDGLIELFDKIQEELYDHKLTILGIVPSNVNFSTLLSQEYLDQLKDQFPNQVTPYIRTDKQIPRSQAFRQTIFDFNPRSKAAQDIEQLAIHIITTGGNSHE